MTNETRPGPTGARGRPDVDGVCPNCGASLPAALVDRRVSRDVERAGCGRCALQLIRRGDGPWDGIRG